MNQVPNILEEIKRTTHCRRNKRLENQSNQSPETFIYTSLKRVCSFNKINQESMPFSYMTNREILIQKIQVYCKKHNMKDASFYAAIYYLDKIMSKIQATSISKKRLALYAITCVILATKFVENDANDINIITFANISDSMNYNGEELRQCEVECLKMLDYQLDMPTIYEFLRGMITCGVLYHDEASTKEFPNEFYIYAKDLLYKVKNSFDLCWRYHPEMISMAIVQASRKHFFLNKEKMKSLMKRFKIVYDIEEYDHCYKAVKQEQKKSYVTKSVTVLKAKGTSKSVVFNTNIVTLPVIQTEANVNETNDTEYEIPRVKKAMSKMTLSHVLDSLKGTKDNNNTIETSRYESNTSLSTYSSVHHRNSIHNINYSNTEHNNLSYSANLGQKNKKKSAMCIRKSCFTNSKLPIIHSIFKTERA